MESIGKRIAYLRQKNGFTQQSLAYRLAISRVAISHIEMDLTIPSERSITLMAGIFKLSPMELVQDTSYPKAKAERLPKGTTIYTQLELELALLKNDCFWFDQLNNSDSRTVLLHQAVDKWSSRLESWSHEDCDDQESRLLSEIRRVLKHLTDQINHPLP